MNVLGWLAGRIGLRPHTDETSRPVSRKALGMVAGGGRLYVRDSEFDTATQEVVFRNADGRTYVFGLSRTQTKKWAARFAAAAARGE